MDPSNLWLISLIFLGLLLLSAFFSGSETAFFSLDKATIRALREKDGSRSRRVTRLLDRPRKLLITILIGNTVVNTSAASLAAIVVDHMARKAGFNPAIALILDIVVVTFLLIVLVEITPKVFAFKNNKKWALNFSSPIQFCYYVFLPVTRVIEIFLDRLSRAFGVESQGILFSDEEIRTLAQVGEEHGVLEEEEREMIHSIFEFGETEVREVMVPRIEMTAIGNDISVGEVAGIIKQHGHSRIPVYEGDIDHIVGIIYAKDLIGNTNSDDSITGLIREPYFVPESKLISSLLKEFQKYNIHIAIVVDEYGGTEGIVTLEDVIEEIVGEIHDEFDHEEVLCKKLDNGDLSVAAKIEVEEFNQFVGEKVVPEEEDYETLGGFIFSLAGEVPKPKQKYTYQGWEFVVTAVEANRVVRLMIHPPEDATIIEEGNSISGETEI